MATVQNAVSTQRQELLLKEDRKLAAYNAQSANAGIDFILITFKTLCARRFTISINTVVRIDRLL